uniref:Uncharacterized protein n=1 Tax=virus sp. ctBS918 TaxID=2825807 RepID=A0A8S5RP48_9VIRU|nr:MAG TPA: hypothetical protein [virus sp. ctBS918]
MLRYEIKVAYFSLSIWNFILLKIYFAYFYE